MKDKDKIIKETFLSGIRQSLVEYFEGNKGQYLRLGEISKKFWVERNWIWDTRCMQILANSGLKARITSEIHNLRNDGYPIVSSSKKGKGYTLIDPNNSETPQNWDSKFLANEKFREIIADSERNKDKELFVRCYESCREPQIRRQMQRIAIKWDIPLKRKKVEE